MVRKERKRKRSACESEEMSVCVSVQQGKKKEGKRDPDKKADQR